MDEPADGNITPGTRRVLIVCFPGVQPLDVVGPHEVFAGANAATAQQANPSGYELQLVAREGGAVRSESGLGLVAEALPELDEPIDTLVLPGGDGVYQAADDAELVDWVRRAAGRARRTATVCSGTFLAGAAGLLAGRTVTTHWARARRLAESHPEATVDADPVYIHDGDLWSSAGVTAGIDLALALVAADAGLDVAQLVARWLVVFLHRPGGQSQFAAPVWSEAAECQPVRRAQALIHADPSADLSIAALAAHAGLSARHFTRLFEHEVGVSPARYVTRIRVAAARRFLETERCGLAAVASRCGFGTAETLRRTFAREVGVNPDDYRRRFAIHPSPS